MNETSNRLTRPPESDIATIRWLVDGNPGVARMMAQVVARQQVSLAWHRRARESAAGLPSQLAYEATALPLCVRQARAAHLIDRDGHEYLDFHLTYTAGLLGHRPEPVVRAVHEALEQGCPAGMLVAEQVELAELIQMATGAERVAVLHTGGQAVEAAVRVARAATGRRLVAKFDGCYHGANEMGLHNTFPMLTAGVPGHPELEPTAATGGVIPSRDLLILRFGDPASIAAMQRHSGELAAVVADPCPPFISGRPNLAREFVATLVASAHRCGVLVVFDEVVTGFRLGVGGAAEAFGVEPDLICFAKVASGLGLPLSLIAGRAALLDFASTDGGFGDARSGKVWLSSTHAANPLAVVASLAQLRYVVEHHSRIVAHLDRLGELVQEEVAAVAQQAGVNLHTAGHPRLQYSLDIGDPLPPDYRAAVHAMTVERIRALLRMTFYLRLEGIYSKVAPTLNLCAAHTDSDVQQLGQALRRAIYRMIDDGALPKP